MSCRSCPRLHGLVAAPGRGTDHPARQRRLTECRHPAPERDLSGVSRRQNPAQVPFERSSPLTVGSPQQVIERTLGFREYVGDYQRQLFLVDHAGSVSYTHLTLPTNSRV